MRRQRRTPNSSTRHRTSPSAVKEQRATIYGAHRCLTADRARSPFFLRKARFLPSLSLFVIISLARIMHETPRRDRGDGRATGRPSRDTAGLDLRRTCSVPRKGRGPRTPGRTARSAVAAGGSCIVRASEGGRRRQRLRICRTRLITLAVGGSVLTTWKSPMVVTTGRNLPRRARRVGLPAPSPTVT